MSTICLSQKEDVHKTLCQMRSEVKFYDLSFVTRRKCNGKLKLIDAHQMVFSGISQLLTDMFKDVKKKQPYNTAYVTVDEVDGDIVEMLIEYIYTGAINVTRQEREELRKLCEILEISLPLQCDLVDASCSNYSLCGVSDTSVSECSSDGILGRTQELIKGLMESEGPEAQMIFSDSESVPNQCTSESFDMAKTLKKVDGTKNFQEEMIEIQECVEMNTEAPKCLDIGERSVKKSNRGNDVLNSCNATLTAGEQRHDEEQRAARETGEAFFEEATSGLDIEAFPFDESNGSNVDIQVDSLNKIALVSSRNATETTTSRITSSKSTTTSNKSPYVPASKKLLENTMMRTRRERAIGKEQKSKHDNAESLKNVGMHKSNGIVMESKEPKSKDATTNSSKNVRTVHKKNSKQYDKRKEAKNTETCRKPPKIKSIGNPNNYVCEKCDLNFNSDQSLQIHQQKANANQNTFRCDQCHFSTKDFRYLQAHVDGNHKGIFKYSCEFCEYATNKRGRLKEHIKVVHNEANAYKCDRCEYSNGLKTNLILHKQVVHEGVKYKCSLCDFTVSYKGDLKGHLIKMHNEGDLLKCDLCSYTSWQKSKITRHKNSMHPQL